MRKVDLPTLAPGHCYLCRSGFDLPQLDTMVDDGAWRVYICERCLTDGARLFGWLDPEEEQKVTAALAEAHERIATLEAELAVEKDCKVFSRESLASELDAAFARQAESQAAEIEAARQKFLDESDPF